jgi:two-component sensor histidine kinase
MGCPGWDATACRLLAGPDDVYAAAPRRRVFAGEASQARHVRRFVKDALDGCPVADTIVLLADELATNALIHTRSGRGGLFEVVVWSRPSSACVAVLDGGSGGQPSPAALDTVHESGRGLALVDALATQWGHAGGRDGRVTWFLVRWKRDSSRPVATGGTG